MSEATYKVRLFNRELPFFASEVEVLDSGWLRAVGSWPRWDEDEATERIVLKRGPTREYTWPPHRVKEVRRG